MRQLLLLATLLALANAHVYVRVAHAAVQAPAVDIKANGTTIVTNLAYPTVTAYLKVPPGLYDIEILAHGTNTSVFRVPLPLEDGKSYTAVATGNPSVADSFTVVPLEDDRSSPADRYTARLRAFHGIADVADAQITLNGAQVVVLAYKQGSAHLNVAAGSYDLAINRKVGDVYSPVFTQKITLTGGTVYTAFAEGLFNDTGVNNIAVSAVADAVYQYLSARVAHASALAPAVDVYLKDDVDMVSTKIVPNLAFGQFSEYLTVAFEPIKNYSIYLTATGNSEPVYSVAAQFVDGAVVTAAAIGVLSNATTHPFHIQFFEDANSAPTDPLTANLKLVHTIPGALPASLVVGSETLFSDVAYDTASMPSTIKAGTFTFHVVVNGSTILTKDITLARGGVYSFYIEGEATTPTVQVATDAAYTYTSVRASHASPESPNVDIVLRDVHGNEVYRFANVGYGQTTPYATVVLQPLNASVEAGGNSVLTSPVTFAQDTQNTVVVFGTLNANFTDRLAASVVQDDNSYPADSNTVHVRFVHAVVGAGPVNVMAGNTAVFSNVAYKQATAYKKDLPQGTYTLSVVLGNTTVVSFTQFFTGGSVYTIFAEGEAGFFSKVAPKQFINLDAAYQYTTLRVAHASSDAPAVDVYLDDGVNSVAAFTNLAYGAISAYKEIVLYNYTLKLTPTGSNNVVYTQAVSFNRNSVYTVAVIGLAKENTTTSLRAVAFLDDRTVPADSFTARGRFVHAVADGAPNVDVYFNDQIKFSNVAYGQATGYVNLDAKSYRVDVYVAGATTKLASADLGATGGQVFTLFAEGTPAKIDAKLAQDFATSFFNLRIAHASPDAGKVDVLVEGIPVWTNVDFTDVTAFREFTSNQKNISVVKNGAVVLQSNTPFPANEDSTVVVVGLVNTTTLGAIVVSDKTTVPSSNLVASVRVTHASPNSPALNIKFNGTVQFTNVAYKDTTAYKEVAAGEYVLEANTTAGLVKTSVVLAGGLSYTLFLEGLFPDVVAIQKTDYFPPSVSRVRLLHASPDTGAVDLQINGSADIRNVEFGKASAYVQAVDGENSFSVVLNGQLKPYLIDTSSQLAQGADYSFFLTGLSDKNATTHLTHLLLADENALPAEGKIKVRFVHASPNAPAVDVKFGGDAAPLFVNVTYLNSTKYVTVDAGIYELQLLVAGKPDVALSSRFDLRVATGSAVYTLVAEGLLQKLSVVAFLDNGSAPPSDHSSPKHHKGLTGLQIGLIIGGVAIGVVILAAVGFILYKRRRDRAGYTEIGAKE